MPMPGAQPPTDPAARGWTLAGPPDAPCLVLLHGVFFGRRSWQLQADALARGWRTLSIDLPGHGELRDVPFSLPGARDHVLRALEAAGIDRAILVGWSLGGFVALEIAAVRPGQVSGLVLTGATMEPRRFLRGPGRLATRAFALAPSGPSTFLALWLVRLVYGRRVAAHMSATGPTIPQGMAALATLPAGGFRERLARYPGPVLLLNGAGDHLVRGGQDAFLRASRNGSMVVVPGAGHLAPLEAPGAVTAAIAAFAEEVVGGSEPSV